MIAGASPYRHQKHLIAAALLALLGLLTALIYTLNSTPYTMVLFLMGGQLLLVVSLIIFVVVVVRDVRSRLESVVARRFAKDDLIFRQGDLAEYFYIISEGEVEAVREDPIKGEIVLGRLGPEEYFGEGAILTNLPYQATARAVTDVEALVIHRSDFGSFYEHLPQWRERLHAEHERRKELLEQALSAGGDADRATADHDGT